MRAGLIRRSRRVDNCQVTGPVDLLKRCQGRVQGEEPIQRHAPLRRRHARIIRARNRDAGPLCVIRRVAEGRHQVQPVRPAPQKQADQHVPRRTLPRPEQHSPFDRPITRQGMPQPEHLSSRKHDFL